MDGNYSAMLKEGIEQPVGCFALGCLPTCWQKGKLVCIRKSGKGYYLNPKNFSQISLTPFSHKCLQGLVKRDIIGKVLRLYPLQENQRGKSCESEWNYAMLKQILLCAKVGVEHYLTTEETKGCSQRSVYHHLRKVC